MIAGRPKAGPRIVDEELLLHLLDVLVSTPSPPGHERRVAKAMVEAGRSIEPGLVWSVDQFDDDRANLLVSTSTGGYDSLDVVLFAHLDTSLMGPAEYQALHAGPDHAAEWSAGLGRSDGLVHGPGVTIAKGPAAGALAALITAARLADLPPGVGVLLTAGGTHRAVEGAEFAAGLRRALAAGLAPRAAINVKAGAPGVLHEEPANAYLRLDVTSAGGPSMLRASTGNEGAAQVIARLGAPVDAWRDELRSMPRIGTSGREVGLGAVSAGLNDKPDMLPSSGRAYVYVVYTPDDDLALLVDKLEDHLHAAGLGDLVRVSVVAMLPGGRTDPGHEVVAIGQEVWTAHLGDPPVVNGWCGCTDGGLLRAHGIPVVRFGPRPRSGPAGLEALELRELLTFAQMDLEAILRLTGAEGDR